MSYDYSKSERDIMRTAFLTSFPKIFTDIGSAHRIFESSLRLARQWGFHFNPEQFVANLAVELEARHKAVSAAVWNAVQSPIRPQGVVELGAGLSPRRIEFSNQDYLEIDLPPITRIKGEIYRELGHPFLKVDLIGANLAESRGLEIVSQAVKDRYSGPLVVVSEGLFWYLSKRQVTELARTIRQLLTVNGGVWITGDCPPAEPLMKEPLYRSVIAESSGREMSRPFESQQDFESFFSNAGFSVDRRPMERLVEVRELAAANLFACSPSATTTRMRAYAEIATLQVEASTSPHS